MAVVLNDDLGYGVRGADVVVVWLPLHSLPHPWVPAFAGMTYGVRVECLIVWLTLRSLPHPWVPAFAGMTYGAHEVPWFR